MGAIYRLSTNQSAKIDLRYLHWRDAPETDSRFVLFPSGYQAGVGAIGLDLLRVEATANVNARNYDRGDRADGTSRHLAANFLPIQGKTTAWLISTQASDFYLNGKRVLAYTGATAGFRRRHFPSLASEWTVGVVDIDYETGAPVTRRGAFTGRLTVYGSGPGQPVVAEARVEQSAATIVSASVRRRLPVGVGIASFRTELDAEGGYYTYPILTRRVSASWIDTLGVRTALSIEGSYGWALPFHASGGRADTYRAEVRLSTPIARWVNGGVGYTFVRQQNLDPATSLNFRRNRIFLSLTGGFS